MRARSLFLEATVAASALHLVVADAQVVRESDVKSIAGVLVSPDKPASWTFKSAGNQVLFATLDADIYRIMEDHEHEASVSAEEGEDCESGGPGRFYIEVQDGLGARLCYAERPAPPPGWQRDPRLACVLPYVDGSQFTYRLVVGLKASHEEHVALAAEAKQVPFILNVSLRRIAPTGTVIQSAIAQSNNGL
jgi:hypothetical protein